MATDTKHEEKVTTKEIAVLELVTFSVGEKKNFASSQAEFVSNDTVTLRGGRLLATSTISMKKIVDFKFMPLLMSTNIEENLSQHFDHCDDAYSLSIRVQTTLNYIRFVNVLARDQRALSPT